MSHQPPVPEGSQSPYPLKPAPIPEEVKQRAAEKEVERVAPASSNVPSQGVLIGIGAAIALGAAAVGAYLSTNRNTKPAKGKRGGSGKRKSGKAKTARKASGTTAD